MRHTVDRVLNGHAMVWDGPLALLEDSRTANAPDKIHPGKHGPWWPEPSVSYQGRKGKGWDALVQFIKSPWPEAREMIQRIIDGVNAGELPKPKSKKRTGRWDENQGEVNVERAMRGEPDYMRDVRRESASGPMSVTLITNLDTFTGANKTGVYWRSAAAIAATDILENAGYTVEMWMWCLGTHVYPKPTHHQFTAARMKEAGSPVDIDTLCDVLSEWFTLHGNFGSFSCCPVKPISIGGASGALKGWRKYLDMTGSIALPIPIVLGPNKAIESVAKILQTVINWKPGDEVKKIKLDEE